MEEKIWKKFFVTKVISPELVSLICLYLEQDTFNHKPMC